MDTPAKELFMAVVRRYHTLYSTEKLSSSDLYHFCTWLPQYRKDWDVRVFSSLLSMYFGIRLEYDYNSHTVPDLKVFEDITIDHSYTDMGELVDDARALAVIHKLTGKEVQGVTFNDHTWIVALYVAFLNIVRELAQNEKRAVVTKRKKNLLSCY